MVDDTTTTINETNAENMRKFFPWRMRTSAFNLMSDGSLTVRDDSVVTNDPMCYHNFNSIDLSGGSITDATGRTTWRLLNTVCLEDVPQGGFLIDYPISFVATPISDKPGYITVKQVLPSPQPNDVFIEVYSWDKAGEPAPSMPFYWRCRIPLTIIIPLNEQRT